MIMMMIHSYQDYYDLHRPPYLSLPCFAPFEIRMKIMLVRLKVMMLMVRMVVMVLMLVRMVVMVRMVVATEEKEDLKIKNPIDDCGDYTDGDEDTFSWCSPGRRSPRGGRWERGQPSTWRGQAFV